MHPSDAPLVRTYTAAGCIVVDDSGERVLLLVRPGRCGPDGKPEVRLPKGHIEPGESREEAAIREVDEEAGLSGLVLLADLGHQIVEFNTNDRHTIRDESYFLAVPSPEAKAGVPESQFLAVWLPWDEAFQRLTYEAEREWLRRAQAASEGLAPGLVLRSAPERSSV